jgi:ribosomal protein S18 acetylase RimI-like enzyme
LELTLRRIENQDESFLLTLFFDSHPELTSIPGLDDATKNMMIRQQFLAESHFLTTQYPDADLHLIIGDGQPIGKLFVNRGPDEYRILVIAVLSEYRNRGIGRRLLEDVLQEAKQVQKRVRLQVMWFNDAARSLYMKLGFEVLEEKGVYCEMQWTP